LYVNDPLGHEEPFHGQTRRNPLETIGMAPAATDTIPLQIAASNNTYKYL
jgi:hypothetical protein